MGRLDRYVGRFVLASYGAALAFMIFLVILIDGLLEGGDYLRETDRMSLGVGETMGLIARYYMLMVPFLFLWIAPFVTVIASMFAVTRMMSTNEVVPMLFSGRSMWRVLRPVLMVGCVSGLAMAACWEFLIPRVADELHEVRSVLQSDDRPVTTVLLRSKLRPDVLLFATDYDHRTASMAGVIFYSRGSGPGDDVVVEADRAFWNDENGVWILENGQRRARRVARPVRLYPGEDLTPDALFQASRTSKQSEELSYSDLISLRQLKPNRPDYKLQFHRHITAPLANLVLLLLALPFAIHFERGRKLERVVYSIGICGAYLVLDLACVSLGMRETVDPVVAAWVPVILFGSLGAVMFGSLRT